MQLRGGDRMSMADVFAACGIAVSLGYLFGAIIGGIR